MLGVHVSANALAAGLEAPTTSRSEPISRWTMSPAASPIQLDVDTHPFESRLRSWIWRPAWASRRSAVRSVRSEPATEGPPPLDRRLNMILEPPKYKCLEHGTDLTATVAQALNGDDFRTPNPGFRGSPKLRPFRVQVACHGNMEGRPHELIFRGTWCP